MGAGGGLGLAAVLAAAVLCGPGALAGRVLSGECAVRERCGSAALRERTRDRARWPKPGPSPLPNPPRIGGERAPGAHPGRTCPGGAGMLLRGTRGDAGPARGMRAPEAAPCPAPLLFIAGCARIASKDGACAEFCWQLDGDVSSLSAVLLGGEGKLLRPCGIK